MLWVRWELKTRKPNWKREKRGPCYAGAESWQMAPSQGQQEMCLIDRCSIRRDEQVEFEKCLLALRCYDKAWEEREGQKNKPLHIKEPGLFLIPRLLLEGAWFPNYVLCKNSDQGRTARSVARTSERAKAVLSDLLRWTEGLLCCEEAHSSPVFSGHPPPLRRPAKLLQGPASAQATVGLQFSKRPQARSGHINPSQFLNSQKSGEIIKWLFLF